MTPPDSFFFLPLFHFLTDPAKRNICNQSLPSRALCVCVHACLITLKKAPVCLQHITFKPSELDVGLVLSWSSEVLLLTPVSWDSPDALNCPISFALMFKLHEVQHDDLILTQWDASLLHLLIYKLSLLYSVHIFIFKQITPNCLICMYDCLCFWLLLVAKIT